MTEFATIELGELAAPEKGSISIGPFGSRMKADVYTATGVPVIRGTNIGADKTLKGDWVFVPEEFADEIPNCIVQPGDLVFPHRGSIGEVALIPAGAERIVLSSSMMKFRVDRTKADPAFLYYYFKSKAGRAEILRFGSQVGTPGIGQPLTSLKRFVTPLPKPGVQVGIARLLASLDDKIELNRRMNETLEEMARALFRDWFVDFGPTRRQIEGATDPAVIMGHAFPPEKAATFAPLFPAKLGDDGFPEGWEEQPFEAFVEIVGGGTPKTKIAEYWGGDIPWFSVVDAPTQGAVYVHSTEKSITNAGLENSSARMVPEGTTIISARGTVGKIGMAPGDMTFNQSCYALRPKGPVGERFVFLATGQLVERLQAMAHGSVFSTITRNTFSSLSFAGADGPCYAAFEDITATLFAKIKANGQENQALAEMRDLLLPKLMSGEIRLKDAGAAK